MAPQNQSSNLCPCGLTKELCAQKHLTIDRDLQLIRNEQQAIESRLREYMDTSEAHMLERLTYQKEIIKEITNNIRESYQEGLHKVVEGLNLHRKDINELQKQMPTKAIDRLVVIEDWKKSLPDNLDEELQKSRDFRNKVILIGSSSVFFLTLSYNWIIKIISNVATHIFTK